MVPAIRAAAGQQASRPAAEGVSLRCASSSFLSHSRLCNSIGRVICAYCSFSLAQLDSFNCTQHGVAKQGDKPDWSGWLVRVSVAMSSLDALTSAQRGQVVHFQAVVNMSDAEQAASILRNHNWSMEDAVANALIMSPSAVAAASSVSHSADTAADPTPQHASAPPPLNTSSASLSSNNYAAVSPASSPTRSLLSSSSSPSSTATSAASTPNRAARAPASLGWHDWLNSYPFGWLLTSALTFCSQLLAAVLPSTLWHGPAAAPPAARHAASSSSAPSAVVTAWLQQWPHSPPFVAQSYLTAVRECKARHKLLFLYLHHPAVRTDPVSFVASTLCSEAMHNFVVQNFVAWMGSAQSGDGARLASTLRVRSYPFVALLAPVNNQLAVMYRREGELTGASGGSDLDEMIHAMLLKMEQYDAMTATERRAEEERRAGRTLREQQDREYQEALEKDREQQRTKEREAERKRKAEEERQAALKAAVEQKQRDEKARQDKLARKQRLIAALPVEPVAGGAAVATVGVRLVDGKKISRRWEDSTAMEQLFDWIDGQAADDTELVRGEAAGQVRVVSNFPRKTHTDGSVTLRSLGLGKQILLLVEPVEADDTQQ